MPEFALPLVLLALPLGLPARLLTVRQRVPAAALREPRATAMLLTDRIGVRRRTRWDTALAAALWCLLVIAIANPRVPGQTLALPVSGRDIILTLDLSGSMKDTDFELDGQPIARIDAVKRVATNLVLRRGGDRIGLVVFADHPYFAAPLTFDMPALARTIDHATIGCCRTGRTMPAPCCPPRLARWPRGWACASTPSRSARMTWRPTLMIRTQWTPRRWARCWSRPRWAGACHAVGSAIGAGRLTGI